MKKSKFRESQIVFALQQAESGVTVADAAANSGEATFCPVTLRRLRQLQFRFQQVAQEMRVE